MCRIRVENFPERSEDLKLSHKKNVSRGFTIIELTVVAAVLAVLSLLIAMILSQGLKAYRMSQNAVRMQDSVAKAVRDFESKTRGAEEVVTADADQLVFFAYIANDTRPAPSRIRYFIDGNKLVRGIISPEGAGPIFSYPSANENFHDVATGVLNTDSVFSYYGDQDYDYGNDAATKLGFPINLAQIKMVRITLRIDFDTSQPPEAVEDSTLVNLRNLKRNL